MAYETLKDLDFSNIYGASTGSEADLSQLVNSLYGTLATGGYFGTDYTSGGEKYGEEPREYLTNFQMAPEGSYNIDFILKSLEQFEDKDDDFAQGMTALAGLLKQFQQKDVIGKYGQDMKSINEEMTSKLTSLTKGYGDIGKSSRYSDIGSGGRNVGDKGSRSDYLTGYYGILDDQNREMKRLRESATDKFMGDVGSWMNLHPSVT